MGLFHDRKKNADKTQAPVWFMRQAGRYHQHYQNIKKDSDFMSMCKSPELAEKITHGPIDDFGFDAAILFSDLLFPLEHLSMGLNYRQGPPKLAFQLDSLKTLEKLNPLTPAREFFQFQKEACQRLRKSLSPDTTLLGFVGAPFTLYTYAVEGGHSGSLVTAKKGLVQGLFTGFCERLFNNLIEEMKLQAEGGADAICLFDTAAGELSLDDYRQYVIPELKRVTAEFRRAHPDKKIIYYSKMTHLSYLHALEDQNIDVLGIDWRVDITTALKELGENYMIQGNIDPTALHLNWDELEPRWNALWEKVQRSGVSPERWICGLGHGVLQHTPEENVKKSVDFIHQNFLY